MGLIRDALGAEGDLFDDHRPAPTLRGIVVSCYVDNFGVMSTDPVKVRKAVENVREVAEARGLDYHELEMCREGFEYLGMEGTGSGLITIKGKRRRRLYQCLRHVLRRKVVSSKQMERIVGQFVSQGLLRRESLSILRACYVFIKRRFKYGANFGAR